MSLREHIQAVYDEHGELTPEVVVDAARPKNHPLHDRFDWDNRSAGESWRRHQAAELIRSLKITYREATETEDAGTIRAYHAVRGPSGHTYQPAEKVAEDPFTKQLVLADMEREWKALRRRYEHFVEFTTMIRADLGEQAA